MFMDLVDFPIESDRLYWEARLVVRDLNQEPHLLMRITLTGTHFPHRALKPFVAVGEVRSLFVSIAEDGLSAHAYFDKPLPQGSRIEFGYGEQALLRFPGPFDPHGIRPLDRKRLPSNTRLVERFLGGSD